MEESDSLRELSGREAIGHGESHGASGQTARTNLPQNREEVTGREGLGDEAEGRDDAAADAHHGNRVADARRLHRAHGGNPPDTQHARSDVGDLVNVLETHGLQAKVATDEGSGRNEVEMVVARRISWTLHKSGGHIG